MLLKDPARESVDPRRTLEREGLGSLAAALVRSGYVIQGRLLIDLGHALRSRKPLLIEGPRGGGKTALAEAMAWACNLTTFYLQGMDDLTIADVLYSWDREAQTQMVRQELAAGTRLKEAQDKQFTREYLILGEALAAFEYAGLHEDPPILIIDEADKLTEKVEDMLLQLLGRGWAHVPRFGEIGVRDRAGWPIVILLSNDIRRDLSAPLRSRCLYAWLDPPTPKEEVRILRARFPEASADLVRDVTKLINCVRRDMPAVRDKPSLRESIDLIGALLGAGVERLTADLIDEHLCFLGKRRKELLNLRQGLARMEFAVRTVDPDINAWVKWAFADQGHVFEEAA
ncbi:MAG: MoxR family ATPase [Acidobacteria bacterium]|nr:MoxR family ATPase [Acidobacteriota bacterium]